MWLAAFEEPKRLIGVTVGVVAVPVLIALTIWRFDIVLILLIVTRIALDALKTGGPGGASLDPSVLVGAVFIAIAGSRLLIVPHRVPASPFTRGLYWLAAAAFVSAVVSNHRPEAFIAASKILSGVLMFAVLEQMLHERPELAKRVVVAALASAVVPVIVAVEQLATGTGNRSTEGFVRLYCTAVTPTSLATYLLPLLAVLDCGDLPSRDGTGSAPKGRAAHRGARGCALLHLHAVGVDRPRARDPLHRLVAPAFLDRSGARRDLARGRQRARHHGPVPIWRTASRCRRPPRRTASTGASATGARP